MKTLKAKGGDGATLEPPFPVTLHYWIGRPLMWLTIQPANAGLTEAGYWAMWN
jgi:hypothetical protein